MNNNETTVEPVFITVGGLVVTIPPPRFSLGGVVITANAARQLDAAAVHQALRHHAVGDWGELVPEDVRENEYALKHAGRLLSAYGTGGVFAMIAVAMLVIVLAVGILGPATNRRSLEALSE